MNPAEIRCRRERLGLTAESLAQVLGIDERNVRRWECGTQGISERNVEQIVQIERRYAQLVEELAAGDRDPLITFATDEQLWKAHPQLRPIPARLHRGAAAEAILRCGGQIAYAAEPVG
ncbi:helix-turn-helix domain-containing protein [Mycolicibacterium fortuitum]